MTDPTPTGPFDPQQTADSVCFPGKAVTVFVTRCDTGEAILMFSIAHGSSDIVSFNNGTNYGIVCAMAGWTIRVAATGLDPVDHVITQAEVDARQAFVCLSPTAPPSQPPHGHWPYCAIQQGIVRENADLQQPLLDDLRGIRSVASLHPTGRALIAAYEDQGFQEVMNRAMRENPEFQLVTIRLVLAASGVKRTLLPDAHATKPIPLYREPVPACSPPVTDSVVADTKRWVELFIDSGGEGAKVHLERLTGFVESLNGLDRDECVEVFVGATSERPVPRQDEA
jgi:hypothetical protein